MNGCLPAKADISFNGIIDTPIWEGMLGKEGAEMQLEQFANALPVQRLGTPVDVAKAAAFLIDNDFVNGTTVVVDGGHRLI